MILAKKILFISLVVLLFPQFLRSQYNTRLYNRLCKELRNAENEHAKVKTMLELADYHIEQSYMLGFHASIDTAYTMLNDAQRFAASIKSASLVAETYFVRSKAYEIEQDYEKSMAEALKAIKAFESIKDNEGVCRASRQYFMSYRYTHDSAQTIALAEKNVTLASNTHNGVLLGRAYEDLAECYHLNRDTNEVLALLQKALYHYNKGGEKRVQNVYSFIANVYTYKGEYDKALHAALQSLKIIEKYNISNYYNITIYNTTASLYKDMGKVDKAIELYLKSYTLSQQFDDDQYHALTARQLAQCYALKNDKEASLRYLKVVEKKYQLIQHPFKEISVALLLDKYTQFDEPAKADYYAAVVIKLLSKLPVGSQAYPSFLYTLGKYSYYKKKYTEANNYLSAFKDHSLKINSRNKMAEAYELLFKIDSTQGNYLSAMHYGGLATRYKDSLFNEVKNRQISELEIQYETAKKDDANLLLKKQTELQRSEISRSNLMRNMSLVAVLLFGIILFLLYRRYRITQKLRKTITIKNEKLELLLDDKELLLKEKEWLLKEIHHRVKNNLQIVMSLLGAQSHFLNDSVAREAIKNSQHRIHSMSLIHKKLYQSDTIVTVNLELYFKELIEYYKIAFDTRQRIRFEADIEPIEMESSQAVPMGLILNEAVNNALKHAFPNEATGFIMISVKTLGDTILFTVKDNGIGMPETINEDYKSLGLNLISGFSRELNAELDIRNSGGVEISIRFKSSRSAVA